MADVIIELLAPIIGDIGLVAGFVSISLMVIKLAINAFTGKELRL